MAISFRDLGRAVLEHLTSVLTLAGLAAVAVWGTSTGWRLPSPFATAATTAPAGEKGSSIHVEPGRAGDPPALRARIVFASPEEVRKAGLEFATAEARPLSRYVTATGSVAYEPGSYAQLSSRAAGTVWWVEKVPGQPVEKGEVLALIDAVQVGKLKADLLTDLTQLGLQTQTFERLQETARSGGVPDRSVRESRAAVENLQTKVLGDRQALINLGLTVDPDEIRKLPPAARVSAVRFLGLPEAVVSRVRGKTESANLLPVVAPFAGFLVRRTVSGGEAIVADKPLFVVAGVRRVHLELAVDPRDVDLLKPGQAVLFTPDSSPGFEAPGTLAHILPEVDQTTRRVWAHAEAENPDGRLRANAFGRGRVLIASDPAAVVVPEAAVQQEGETPLVFVRTGGAAFDARRVTPGLRAGGLVAVGGVRPGEAVVTTGGHALLAELRRDQLAGGE